MVLDPCKSHILVTRTVLSADSLLMGGLKVEGSPPGKSPEPSHSQGPASGKRPGFSSISLTALTHPGFLQYSPNLLPSYRCSTSDSGERKDSINGLKNSHNPHDKKFCKRHGLPGAIHT